MRRLFALLAALAAAILLSTSSASAATGWTTLAMVWNGDYNQPSMVVDTHGKVRIVASCHLTTSARSLAVRSRRLGHRSSTSA